VVHADDFVAMQVHHDEHGLAHEGESVMSGEAWEHGPIVLSWADVTASGADGESDVVVHEVAHAIDMLNGDANGFPPLHADMPIADWVAAFSSAFDELGQRVAAGQSVWPVDPYAIESPAECFAVFTESFFLHPRELRAAYPQVYAQLSRFYRQQPADRLEQWSRDQGSKLCRTCSTC
jgi:MtfA peptidase